MKKSKRVEQCSGYLGVRSMCVGFRYDVYEGEKL